MPLGYLATLSCWCFLRLRLRLCLAQFDKSCSYCSYSSSSSSSYFWSLISDLSLSLSNEHFLLIQRNQQTKRANKWMNESSKVSTLQTCSISRPNARLKKLLVSTLVLVSVLVSVLVLVSVWLLMMHQLFCCLVVFVFWFLVSFVCAFVVVINKNKSFSKSVN